MAWIKMTIPRIRFSRFGNNESVDWSVARGVKFIYKAIAGATGVAKFDNLFVTAGADGNALTGAFRARYKFVFEDGTFTDESLPSPVSEKVGLSAEALEFQIPQQSAIAMDTQTTAVWLYIWSASMGAYYRAISPISMNRAKKSLYEWGAFPQDGIISADDRMRILTIGRRYGRRYTPGEDPIYTVSSGTTTAPISVVAAVVPTSTYSTVGTGFNSGQVVPFDLYSNYALPAPMGDTIAFFNVPSITSGSTVTNVGISGASVLVVTTAFDGGVDFRYAVQIAGVNYYKAIQYTTRVMGLTSMGSDNWAVSPATGITWTAAERNTAKFGFSIAGSVVPSEVDWCQVNGLIITDSYTIPGGSSATVIAKNVLTFRIQTSEAALLQRNERLEVNREGPPDNIIAIVGSYFTRTLCLSTDYLYISDPGRPSLYPIFQKIKVADGVNEEALWMHKAAGSVFIGTTKDIYRLSGTLVEFPNGTLDAALNALNIGSPPIDSAVAFEGNSLVYRASDGPRLLVGESSTPLRGDLNLLLSGLTRHGVPAVGNTGRHRLAMSEGFLYWAIPPQAAASTRHSAGEWLGSANSIITASERRRILTIGYGAVQEGTILRYDFPSRLWSRRPYSRVFRSLTRDLQGRIIGGTGAGEVVTLNTGTQDNARDIPVTILTTQQDDGRALSRKVPFDLSIRMDTGGNVADIGIYLDSATTAALTFQASTSGQQVYKTDISSLAAFRRIQLKFEGSFSTFKLYDWNVSYRDMPQHHYYLDTGNIATANDYQWYREIVFLLKSSYDVIMDVYFDDVLLSTNTITVTAGVTTQYQIPLGRAIRGRQPRVVVRTTASASASENGFELYWVQWKVRESGDATQKKTIRWSAVTK